MRNRTILQFRTWLLIPAVLLLLCPPSTTHAEDASRLKPANEPNKTLPPLDCWHCPGPPAHAPCYGNHAGFLYYGSFPWDDDCMNGFDDCPSGDCGHLGWAISVHWIRLHTGRRPWFKPCLD